ncbi:hypothetical protein CRP01_29465 [Flavilitoribacter nigricans DSM 23189 = NBRC 102662]|uniref:DUF4230 domain-containing protein n=1 Tax=Flavilitoribacter nigricans (strain ATCC 23147 / DSM 23189 / NBRC 102662 / NCIMB 1420 / SS-2) TaxID=1122177 RepID=A0A2D0N3B4_FLAN2|nr:hypothetical protein CRP01_29465 [Flavilitoribacter nigricans DSM 23189 = NBRC 102662]
MSERSSSSPSSPKRSARLILVVLILSFLGIVLFRYYQGGSGFGNFTNVPKEYQVNYLPADFKANIDEENAMAILANPRRYRREFDDLVYNLNRSIIDHVANRMGLPDSLKTAVYQEYERQHPYLSDLYYNDFIQLKDTTSTLYQSWYDNESINAVDALKQIASRYTCFLVTQIITQVVQTRGGTMYIRGDNVDTPCGVAVNEALAPMMQRLEDRAAIEDFGRSKGIMEEKIERTIAELATFEVRDKKGITKNLQTKIWGFNVSSSDVEITAISILKIGFRLDDYFDVSLNDRSGVVTVTLPEPTILSHEVYPRIDKLDIGWLREVKDVNLNESFNLLRDEFRREARSENSFDRAKEKAVELMNTMFTPVLGAMNKRFKLKIRFESRPDSPIDRTQEDISD